MLADRRANLLDGALDLLVGEFAVVRLAEIPELRADAAHLQRLRRYFARRCARTGLGPGHRHDRKVVAIPAGALLRQIQELRDRLHDVALQQYARDQLSRERTRKAVAAQDQGVVG